MPDFTMTPIGSVRSTRSAPEDDRWDAETSSIELDPAQFGADAPRGDVHQPMWIGELMRAYWSAE